jgi:glycosyltransferase involved in cell wall biosynthesis
MVSVSPEDARAAREELGVTPDEVLVGVFGRLQRWKAQDVFIEAATRVAATHPRTKFVVVGGSVFGLEPEYFAELRATVAARGLDARIGFTGFRTDVPRLMAACDVVCHTSRVPEPFGLVVIEAMSLGRAVIATRGGGPSEIVGSDQEGILVPADDPAALAQAITELVDDPERRRRMGEMARARVSPRFTIETMATNLLKHLDSI